MTGKIRRTFTPEFKLEAAQLLAEQNYSIREAASAGLATLFISGQPKAGCICLL